MKCPTCDGLGSVYPIGFQQECPQCFGSNAVCDDCGKKDEDCECPDPPGYEDSGLGFKDSWDHSYTSIPEEMCVICHWSFRPVGSGFCKISGEWMHEKCYYDKLNRENAKSQKRALTDPAYRLD